MPRIVRRTSTKVINGVVSPKNREDATDPRPYAIIRESAGRGFRHVVSARHLEQFIRLIPDADQLLQGVEKIILSGGSEKVYGWHRELWRWKVATIELCAWTKDIWAPMSIRYFRQHQPYIDALGVTYSLGESPILCRFTMAQARAFSLLHVFMHELGHHQDWKRRRGGRMKGLEAYADEFALRYFDLLLPLYREKFGDPAANAAPPPPTLKPAQPLGKDWDRVNFTRVI